MDKEEKKKHPGGRPSKAKNVDFEKVSEEFKGKRDRKSNLSDIDFSSVLRLAEMGMTNDHIAEFLNIARSTFYEWLNKYPKFSDALKEAKAVSDEKVEESLYHRARGYSHPETKIFCNKDGDITEVDTIKHYPPDPTSIIFWLKNRKPAEWRDRIDLEGKNIQVTLKLPKGLTEDDL